MPMVPVVCGTDSAHHLVSSTHFHLMCCTIYWQYITAELICLPIAAHNP